VKRLLALGFGSLVLMGGVFGSRLVRRHVVEGRSMLQAYAPGQRLVVESLTYRLRPPRVAEAVVIRQRGTNGRLDLKRIVAGPGSEVTVRGATDFLGKDEWYLLGDNLDESSDSRDLGPVNTSDILGRVWFRY
jgi:signal peptidase I